MCLSGKHGVFAHQWWRQFSNLERGNLSVGEFIGFNCEEQTEWQTGG